MENIKYFNKIVLLFFGISLISSYHEEKRDIQLNSNDRTLNIEAFTLSLQKHLKAVTDKDLQTLKETLPPKGNTELIQSNMEVIYSAEGFLKFHEAFFKIVNTTLEFKITSINVGNNIGVATTEAMYKELERNGKPYFNRLIVTYVLEKLNGKWYVIKDHASSIEKTKN